MEEPGIDLATVPVSAQQGWSLTRLFDQTSHHESEVSSTAQTFSLHDRTEYLRCPQSEPVDKSGQVMKLQLQPCTDDDRLGSTEDRLEILLA